MRRPVILPVLLVAFLGAFAACRPLGNPPAPAPSDGPVARILVLNNIFPLQRYTVRVYASVGGLQRVLGGIDPQQAVAFEFPEASASGQFRLVASTTMEGPQIVSDPFPLPPGGEVTWDIKANLVRRGIKER
jgi:hypothetical protein